MLYAILKPIAVALMRLFFRLEVVSPGLVPATGPVLLVSNHVSVLDPPFVGGAAPRPREMNGQGGQLSKTPQGGGLQGV